MTKQELMTKAHQVARNLLMIKSANTYRAALAEALRRVWAGKKRGEARAEEAKKPARIIYLNVPFSRKDEAKRAGAKWDADVRSWFVIASVVPESLRCFANPTHNARMLSGASWA